MCCVGMSLVAVLLLAVFRRLTTMRARNNFTYTNATAVPPACTLAALPSVPGLIATLSRRRVREQTVLLPPSIQHGFSYGNRDEG